MATKYLNLSTDSTFSENSDYLIPSQKAIKTAVDAKQNKITTGEGLSLSEDGQLINTVLDKTVLASNYVNPTLWKGTLAEYEALGTYDDNITYIITDDTDLEDMINDDVVSTLSTYSSSKINELLSNSSTNIQGGEYIDVIKPKSETLYEYDVFDLALTQYGVSTCNNIVLNTNVFDYVGVSMLDFIRISPTHSNDLYGSQLPESFIPYLIPATKKDGTQYTVEEILTQEYINMLNGTYETPFETFAEMLDYASYSNAESTALVYIVKFEQEGASFLIAVYPDKNGNYIHLAGGMYDVTPINTIELESSDKALTIDWNEKALSMFENLSVDESNLVHKTEDEEIAGVKTFKDSINFVGGDFQQDVLNNVLRYNAPNGATFVNTLVSNVSGETDTDGDGTAEKIALGVVYQGMSNYTSSQELMNNIAPRQGVTSTTGYMIVEGEGSAFACGASAKDSITSKMFGLDETSGAKITQVSTGLIEASANSKFANGSIDSNAHLHIDAQLNQIDMSITNNLNSKTTGINLKDGVMTFTADSFVGLPEMPEQVSKVSELENDSNYISNTATGEKSITINGTATTYKQAVNIGESSRASNYSTAVGTWAGAEGAGSTAIGRKTRALENNSIAIGVSAESNAAGAIALGAQAKNNEAKTFKVALTDASDSTPATDESTGLYTLLTSDGKIPNERLNINENDLVHKSGNEELTGLKTISLVTTPLTLLDNNDLYNEEHYTVTSEIKVNDKVVKTQYSNTFEPKTLPQSVTPTEGYDGLGKVDIAAVTSAIDPNILAENIKKNISILGVTGTYDNPQVNQESKTVTPSISSDIVVTPDDTYDALLKVIVKAVTASIDPNIIPKNIRKNVSILGVMGTLEEGGEQKWFDFSGISNYIPIGQVYYGEGGRESINSKLDVNNFELKSFINENFTSINNISGIMFTEVYGYENTSAEYNELEQVYINFIDGKIYPNYDKEIAIPTQKRYFYPYTNDYGVKGLTIGLDEDDGSERTMKLYLLETVDSTAIPVPVLVNGTLTPSMLPNEFNSFRYIKDITIPAHERFEPKNYEGEVIWNLQDRNEINTEFAENTDKPADVYTSGYDINYGEEDITTEKLDRYTTKNGVNVAIENNIAKQIYLIYDEEGYVEIPETFEKQDGSYYYFKFSPKQYYGYSNYYTLASCDGLFVLYLYRYKNEGYWCPSWRNSWSASNNGSVNYTTTSTYRMYNGNVYYYRVYVNGSSTKIEWSSNGYTWYTMATVTNATYINPTNSNKLKLYVNNEPQNTLYPEGCYVEKDGEIIYKYFDEIYRKETSHCVIPLERDKTLFVNRDLNRVIPYYKGDEEFSYESYNPETKLLSMGHYGYLNIPQGFNTSSLNSWEIGVHFKTPAILSNTNRHIYTWLGGSTSYKHCLWINTSNKLNWRIYSGSGSSTILNGQLSDYQFVVGQDYYCITKFTGRAYHCIVSKNPDMSNPVVYYTLNSATKAYSSTSYLIYGNYTTGQNQSIENIYLDNYSYVKTNDEYLWKPLTNELNGNIIDYVDNGDPIQLPIYLAEKKNKTPKLKDAQWNGSLVLTNDDEVSNFSPTNYIVTENKFNPQNKPWEINLKFKVSNYPIRSNDAFFFGCTNYDCGLLIGTSGKTLHAWLSSNRTDWNIGEISTSSTIDLDTEYYVRMTYDLSAYKLYLSTDGEVYNEVGSKDSTTTIYPMQIYIGAVWDLPKMYLEGSFYLKDCNIKIDGKEWWKPEIIDNPDNYEYIISNNSNWTTEDLNNIKQVGIVDVPLHGKWGFEHEAMKWISSKILIFNLEDEDAILYTEVIK